MLKPETSIVPNWHVSNLDGVSYTINSKIKTQASSSPSGSTSLTTQHPLNFYLMHLPPFF